MATPEFAATLKDLAPGQSVALPEQIVRDWFATKTDFALGQSKVRTFARQNGCDVKIEPNGDAVFTKKMPPPVPEPN